MKRAPAGFEGLFTTGASGEVITRSIRVRVAHGPDAGLEHVLGFTPIVVGAGTQVDLRLSDPGVSRRHVELTIVDDGVRVRDLDSRNGTWNHGARITDAVVATDVTLTIGSTRLSFIYIDHLAPRLDEKSIGGLTSNSPEMQSVLGVLARIAPTSATLLLEGETGVGKDVVAHAVHAASTRASAPFVVLDCTAIAPDLMASELFGHRKGAFTGANEDRGGVFEAAHGGTIFLDEIGELPKEMQAALLRVLENRQVRRVGESHVRNIDVRVLSATNRDLAAEVTAGQFREDLYHRLAVVRVAVPPLRARREDILELAGKFLEEHGRSLAELRPADRSMLTTYPWPGNIRELRNVVARSVALSREKLRLLVPTSGPRFADERSMPLPTAPPRSTEETWALPTGSASDVGPSEVASWAPGLAQLCSLPLKEARSLVNAHFDAAYAQRVLEMHDGNVSKAAEHAAVARTYMYRLLKKSAAAED